MPVRKFSQRVAPIFIGVMLILAGCNFGATPAPTQDINAESTSIVGTTIAQFSIQFTQTALANPSPTTQPTNTVAPTLTSIISTASGASPTAGTPPTISFNATPLPGFTPLPSPTKPGAATQVLCDNNVFEGDVTVPDGTVFKPGEDFVKTWAVRNTGTCKWDEGYKLIFYAGDKAIDPYDFIFKKGSDFISPGQAVNFSIKLTAPLAPGDYQGHWKMQNDQGQWFGTFLSVYITVAK